MKRWLFDNLGGIEARITVSGRILLFLDFDGTLAPIVDDPALAQTSQETREVLMALSRRENLVLAIVSGRSLTDVRARVDIPGLIYAGNHGMEIHAGLLSFLEPCAAAQRQELQRILQDLTAKLDSISGVLVENKGITASVHYRQVGQGRLQEVERRVRAALAPWGHRFRLTEGKKVLEIRPRLGWHKGSAVQWIRRRIEGANALAIYVGDDRTDEEAFATLLDGITIRVGAFDRTLARFRVSDPAEVLEFLKWLNMRLSATQQKR